MAIKPSKVTPQFTAPFKAMIAAAPHLRDVQDVFGGDGETGGLIADLTDTVVFTGSMPTGREVQERAARPFKQVFLKLSGSDPAVIVSSADPVMAAEVVARGARGNARQPCCAIEHVSVHGRLLPVCTGRIVAQMQALQLNTGSNAAGAIGPIIFARQVESLRARLRRHSPVVPPS